jgi:AcrR family transcriptional regulator
VTALAKTKTIVQESENIQELILNVAADAFAEHGFSGTSLRDIGEMAGINFQSIRYHFGSKEALWEKVVQVLCRNALEAGLHYEQVLAALPLKDQLRAQVRALIAYQAANPNLNRILMRESMKNSERYKKIYPLYVSRFFELVERRLGKLQKASVIKNNIPLKDLVLLFHGALNYRLIAQADSEFYTKKSVTSEAMINQHADALTNLLLSD